MSLTVGALWGYFSEHRNALANEFQLIASNEKVGAEVYIAEEKGFPCFSVDIDGEEVYRAETCSCMDAERTYDTILSTYINSNEGYDDGDDGYEEDDDDALRVEDIKCAVEDLLFVLLDLDPYEAGMTPQDVDQLTSVIEQHLHDDFGFSVRHPTEVDGEIVQYPFGGPEDDDEEGEEGEEDEDEAEVEP